MTPLQILRKARKILTPKGAWTRGALARDSLGIQVDPKSESAACWCSVGALHRVTERGDAKSRSKAWDVLQDIAISDLDEWNDTEHRRQDQVLLLYSRAIAKLSKPRGVKK